MRAQLRSRVSAVRCLAAGNTTKVVFKLARRVEFGQVGADAPRAGAASERLNASSFTRAKRSLLLVGYTLLRAEPGRYRDAARAGRLERQQRHAYVLDRWGRLEGRR
jgi:hypothetical protein